MHVLTKMFIVLVSLLAVMLVPLVVVYAHNEDSFKAKYLSERAKAVASEQALSTNQQASIRASADADSRRQQLETELKNLQATRDRQEAEIRTLQTKVAEGTSMQAKVTADLATLSAAIDAGQKLTQSLVEDLKTSRDESLADKRRSVELDEALREISAQLEVAVAARRALQEELTQLKDEHAKSLDTLRRYVAAKGRLDEGTNVGMARGIAPDRDLTASVVNVVRGGDQALAEINVGSRDGVKEDWVLTISRGGEFLGNLRITKVDISRSTGVITLEDPTRGQVGPNDKVTASRGVR